MEVKKTHSADLDNSRTTRFLLALVMILSVVFVALEWTSTDGGGDFHFDMPKDIQPDPDMIPAMTPEEQKASEAPAATTDKPTVNEEAKEVDKQMKIEAIDRTTADAEQQTDGNGQAEKDDKNEEEMTQAIQPVAIDENADKVKLRVVEELPQFPGGPVELMKWLTRNLVYPPQAKSRKIEGEVMVSFIIAKDGTVVSPKVAQSAHPLLDAEAMRVVRMMPKWKPGTEKGKPAKAMVAIPIVFKL